MSAFEVERAFRKWRKFNLKVPARRPGIGRENRIEKLVIAKWNFQLFAGLKMQHLITASAGSVDAAIKKERKKIIFNKKTWNLCSVQKDFPIYVPAIKKYWMAKRVSGASVKCTFPFLRYPSTHLSRPHIWNTFYLFKSVQLFNGKDDT